VPLVRALTGQVPGPAAGFVHLGATSQDVLDTATALVARRALEPLREDLAAAAARCWELAEQHRDTVMAGRTLMQQALPTTFGLKAAGWAGGLDAGGRGLTGPPLPVQLGGAAGTLASLGEHGLEVRARLAESLGLPEPLLPWHTERTPVARLGTALGIAGAAVGKVASDVVLMSQTEVADVTEGAPGGSSTMPHKRNPVAAICARACAAQGPGLVATLLATMVQEHERAAGAWHAEWRPVTERLRSTGSAATWLRRCLDGLTVSPERMRRNLDATGGLLLAERVTGALAPDLGRLAAHDLVERACAAAVAEGRPLRDVLARDSDVRLEPFHIDRLLDPASYVGVAGALVDRALAAHREEPE
jgi:3-carboxy-cis,cis-muconate cycloisomerase